MANDDKISAEQSLAAIMIPIARLMIENDIMLNDAVKLLKAALVETAFAKVPDASASHVSLMTGVHRKDTKRLERKDPMPERSSAAARVLTIWQNDPLFQDEDGPRDLSRDGEDGFDALVRSAKVDAAPATVLSLLRSTGNVEEHDGNIRLVSTVLVPVDSSEKLKTAVATLLPHLETTIGNVVGDKPQWDRALRYSHLSEAAARSLEEKGAKLALEMLQTLNAEAKKLQQEEEGSTLFVAGTFMHTKGKEA